MALTTLELSARDEELREEQQQRLLHSMRHAHGGSIKQRTPSLGSETDSDKADKKVEVVQHSRNDDEHADDEDAEDAEPIEMSDTSKRYGYALAALMVLITLYSIPSASGGKSVQYVWWCGWLTAVATGLGALPFYWIHDVDKFWLGICNGLAAGMMLAATACLFYEGWFIPQHFDYGVSVGYRLFVGAFLGVLFIKFTKVYLEDHEDVKVCGLKGMDARKALLIMAVMTLHSVSEGIGVGVSFGGEGGVRRGHIVTMTMAIHNIPEGVAISLALVPRGLSVFFATLWCILSSVPQPLFAVPSFMFVEQSLPILPAGLGFAGGAMAYVAIKELLPESLEDTKSLPSTVSATSLAFMVFLTIQLVLSGNLPSHVLLAMAAGLEIPVRVAPRPDAPKRLTMRRVIMTVAAALLVSAGVVVSNENAASVVQDSLHSVTRHLRGADAASSVRSYYSSYWANRGPTAVMEGHNGHRTAANAMEAHGHSGRGQRWVDVANMEAKLAVRESHIDQVAAMEAKNNNGRGKRWVQPGANMMESENVRPTRSNIRTRRPFA
ncbi:hypothetical protein ATCC90586_005792 [Pythium insidiosum]|nr:hypothetical protein ATCC90586_005792 [Pythium insidiosum]